MSTPVTMTNDELAEAIAINKEWVRTRGTGYADYALVMKHLEQLLLEQLKRARERPPVWPYV